MKKVLLLLLLLFSLHQTNAQENIALNKPATASDTNGGNIAGNVNDGNLQSRWETTHGLDNQWIEIDLEGEYDLISSTILWEGASAATYEFMVSQNREEWKTIATYSSTQGARTDEFIFDEEAKEVRYIKLNLLTRTTIYGFSIYEWEIYGVAGNTPSIPSSLTINPKNALLLLELPEEPVILSLNNSLIDYNDQNNILEQLAQSAGKKLNWTKHTQLGQSLKYHYDQQGSESAKVKVASKAWSHIILQEQSEKPRTNASEFHESVRLWVQYIRTYCPNPYAKIILTMNWPYTDSNDFAGDMEELYTSYNTISEELGVTIVPVGYAYQLIYDEKGESAKNALYTDNRHPSILASYLSACTIYSAIFNASPTGISYYPSGVNQENAVMMQNYAWRVWQEHEQVVDHHEKQVRYSYTLLDQFNRPLQTELPVNWSVNNGGEITDGTFTSNRTEGTFTVTAALEGFSTSTFLHAVTTYEEEPDTYFVEIEKNGVYTQNFDEIGTEAIAELPIGWKIEKRLDAPRTLGSFRLSDNKTEQHGGINIAGDAKNGIYNFGAGEAGTAADRAIGGISTGVADGTRGINIYLKLKNQGDSGINSFDIAYNVEKYRKGENPSGFRMQLYYSKDGENWKSAGQEFYTYFAPDNETGGYNSVPGETRSVTANLSQGLKAGEELYLAWNYSVNSGTTANAAQALGLDDVIITASDREIPDYAPISWSRPYLQDFDEIGTEAEAELPVGWKIEKRLDAPRTLGLYESAGNQTEQHGGINIADNAKNGIYNFGAGEADTATDRAIGGISTGVADGTRGINMYLKVKNNEPGTIQTFNIEYDVEKYREGKNPGGFRIQMYYSANGKEWISAGDKFYTYFAADDQTKGYSEVPGEVVHVTGTLSYLLPQGENLYLAWNYSVAEGTDAQAAQALALDNVLIEASEFTNPTSYKQDLIWNGENEEVGTSGSWSENSEVIIMLNEDREGINQSEKYLFYKAESGEEKAPARALSANLGNRRRISMLVKMLNYEENNRMTLILSKSKAEKEYHELVYSYFEGTENWQKVVFDFSNTLIDETPDRLTIHSEKPCYISDILIEGDPYVNGVKLVETNDLKNEDKLTLTGSWLETETSTLSESMERKLKYNDLKVLQEMIQGNTKLTGVDMTEANYIVNITNIFTWEESGINPNCLVYVNDNNWFPEATNVINENSAYLIELKDGYPFNALYEFNTESITYERNCYFDGGWETLVLPFDLTGIKENKQLISGDDYMIESFETLKEDVISFKTDNQPEANTPVIFKFVNGQPDEPNRTFTFYGEEQLIPASSTISFNEVFKGTYQELEGEGKFLLNLTGSAFGKGNETSKVLAFRAYIDNNSEKTRYVIRHADDATSMQDETIQDLQIIVKEQTIMLETAISQSVWIHSIDGKLIHTLNLLPGTYPIKLEKGFYLINNQKIAIY